MLADGTAAGHGRKPGKTTESPRAKDTREPINPFTLEPLAGAVFQLI
jgi:hypothetical protein